MKKPYYSILGVYPTAGPHRMEDAYRERVQDIDSGCDLEWPLPSVQEAFSVLGYPPSRQHYDQSWHKVPIPQGPAPPAENIEARQSVSRHSDLGEVSLTAGFRTSPPSLEEIFERLWRNFTLKTRPKAEMVKSLVMEIQITPEQAITGGAVRIMVPALRTCVACRGHGDVGPYVCIQCDGRGAIAAEYPVAVSFPPALRLHQARTT